MEMWWKLTTLVSDDVETLTMFALERGAAGSQILNSNSAVVYVAGTSAKAESMRGFLLEHGATAVTIEAEPETNWVAHCNEIWQPVQVGNISVVPIVDRDTIDLTTHSGTSSVSLNEIRLIPNTAFGTGHHESTQQILAMLQESNVKQHQPKEILDVGTGTGVLAFAAALLFPNTEISALDVDSNSIERAKENQILNPTAARVNFYSGTFDQRFSNYDLITANIYAEILSDYEPLFYAHLNTSGLLILAGVLDELAPALEQKFARRFHTIDRRVTGEWVAYLNKKI